MYKQSTTGHNLCIIIAMYIELYLWGFKEDFTEKQIFVNLKRGKDENYFSVYPAVRNPVFTDHSAYIALFDLQASNE